jgi:hypothetical protein
MNLVALEGEALHCQGHITERLHLRDRGGHTSTLWHLRVEPSTVRVTSQKASTWGQKGAHMNLVALKSGALHCQGHITERLHLGTEGGTHEPCGT